MMNVISTYEITGLRDAMGEHVCSAFEDEFVPCRCCQMDALCGLSELADSLPSDLVAEEIRLYILKIAGNIEA
jgi:hypothetical protein